MTFDLDPNQYKIKIKAYFESPYSLECDGIHGISIEEIFLVVPIVSPIYVTSVKFQEIDQKLSIT